MGDRVRLSIRVRVNFRVCFWGLGLGLGLVRVGVRVRVRVRFVSALIKTNNKSDFLRFVNPFPVLMTFFLLSPFYFCFLGANCVEGSMIPSKDACPAGSIL